MAHFVVVAGEPSGDVLGAKLISDFLNIGGGLQYNKTELYYLGSDYKDRGVDRAFFKTYVVQLGYGFGMTGFAATFYVRYGFNPDLDGANSLNIGLQYDFNFPKLKKIDDPNSRL